MDHQNATSKVKCLKKYGKQTILNTRALVTKNLFEVLCESGEKDCNKSASASQLLKQMPNEDLNRAKKKQPSLFLIHS